LAQRGNGIAYLYSGETQPEYMPGHSNGDPDEPGHVAPRSRRNMMKRVAKAGIARTSKVSSRLSKAIERRAKDYEIARYKRASFNKGDQLFIPWGEWWDSRFITKLEQCHKQGVVLIQVLHDMSPIVVPQFSNSGNATETFPVYMRHILPITDLVLSVSKNSASDAKTWLKQNKLHEPPIKVFRLGDDIKVSKPERPDDEIFNASKLKGNDFIMCVGTIELKKNHMMFYYVYKLAHARGIELPKLVIAGRLGWLTEATYELMTKDPEVKDKFVFQLNKSDEILSWLYGHCLFTVLPSFYEGWGIPIAESLARGVPCISSNTSSMTEIAEDFVEHFSPASSDECLGAIQKMLKPATLEAARKRTKQYVPYSWDDSFVQVKKYMEILK
jgi:glycosyltransferase involved in cell wall biosynthesis